MLCRMPATIDPALAMAHLEASDRAMARLVARIGPPDLRPGDGDPFHALARAIVFQQLSGKAAGTIFNRLLALLSGGAAEPAGPSRSSPAWTAPVAPAPRPELVLARTDEELRSVGLSRQ